MSLRFGLVDRATRLQLDLAALQRQAAAAIDLERASEVAAMDEPSAAFSAAFSGRRDDQQAETPERPCSASRLPRAMPRRTPAALPCCTESGFAPPTPMEVSGAATAEVHTIRFIFSDRPPLVVHPYVASSRLRDRFPFRCRSMSRYRATARDRAVTELKR
jgi:hypothetical protein